MNTVRIGKKYIYKPVPIDEMFEVALDHVGKIVKVVKNSDIPNQSKMGICYIEDWETKKFLGLVSCNSLKEIEK